MAKQKSLSDQMVEEAASIRSDRETLLHAIASEDRPPSGAELTILMRYGFSDLKLIEKELRRVRRLQFQRAVAGSPADRVAAAEYAKKCAESLSTDGEKLDAQIAELTAKKSKLERESAAAARRLEEMETASKSLIELLPPDIAQERHMRLAAAGATLRQPMVEAQSRLHELRIATVKPSDSRQLVFWFEHWQRRGPQFVRKDSSNHWQTTEAWQPAVRAMQEEMSEIEASLPELQKRFDDALAEIENDYTNLA